MVINIDKNKVSHSINVQSDNEDSVENDKSFREYTKKKMSEDVSSKLIDKESFEISIQKENQLMRNQTIT